MKYSKQTEILIKFFNKFFYNFKIFKLSLKYPKKKSYLFFFYKSFDIFKTFKLSLKYPKQTEILINFFNYLFF